MEGSRETQVVKPCKQKGHGCLHGHGLWTPQGEMHKAALSGSEGLDERFVHVCIDIRCLAARDATYYFGNEYIVQVSDGLLRPTR